MEEFLLVVSVSTILGAIIAFLMIDSPVLRYGGIGIILGMLLICFLNAVLGKALPQKTDQVKSVNSQVIGVDHHTTPAPSYPEQSGGENHKTLGTGSHPGANFENCH